MFHPRGPTFFELVEQALSSTEHGYDLLAPKFDYTPFRTPEPVLEAMAREIGAPGSVGSALDLCCGTGAAMRHLRPLCRERVVGVDLSRGMLAEARRSLAGVPGSARVELLRGDVIDPMFHEEFEIATCFGALGHILPRDEDRFVASVARALKPGGRFLFASGEVPPAYSPWCWLSRGFNGVMHLRNALVKPRFVMYYLGFAWPDVRSLLQRHGFEPSEQRCPSPYQQVILVSARRGVGAFGHRA